MANHVCIFPVGKLAAAQAYQAGVNAYYAANYEPGGMFAYLRPDSTGDWVVPYWGSPFTWNGVVVTEPADLAALRVDGVIEPTAVWPEEEV